MEWGWRWDRYYTNTTEIVGSVRPGTLYYKYARNYFKFNLRRESGVVKKQCSYSFEWHIADFYEELKKMCSLFICLFLVVVFKVGGGSCFLIELRCSQFKILCKFQVYSNVICLYLCMYIYQRRQWHPTPVLLPGKSHGWRSLVGCSPWGH